MPSEGPVLLLADSIWRPVLRVNQPELPPLEAYLGGHYQVALFVIIPADRDNRKPASLSALLVAPDSPLPGFVPGPGAPSLQELEDGLAWSVRIHNHGRPVPEDSQASDLLRLP